MKKRLVLALLLTLCTFSLPPQEARAQSWELWFKVQSNAVPCTIEMIAVSDEMFGEELQYIADNSDPLLTHYGYGYTAKYSTDLRYVKYTFTMPRNYSHEGVEFITADYQFLGQRPMFGYAKYRVIVKRNTTTLADFYLDYRDADWWQIQNYSPASIANGDVDIVVNGSMVTVKNSQTINPPGTVWEFPETPNGTNIPIWEIKLKCAAGHNCSSGPTNLYYPFYHIHISGPSYLPKQMGTWTARVIPGIYDEPVGDQTGPFQYAWRYRYSSSEPWSNVVGTSKTFSKQMIDRDFQLKVTVTLGDQVEEDTHWVYYYDGKPF